MAVNYKVLGQVAPLATTETDIYNVPGATEAVTSSVVICNRGAVSATFRLSVADGGGATANKDYIYYDLILAANDTFIATVGITLSSGDSVRAYASTADLSFSLFGSEIA